MPPWVRSKEVVGSRRRALLYLSCLGEHVEKILASHTEFSERYVVDRVVTHELALANIKDLAHQDVRGMFESADVVLSYQLEAKWGNLSTDRVMEIVKSGCRVITCVPPNNAALWVINEHFGEHGVAKMLQAGRSVTEIRLALANGQFDPCFGERWAGQIQRLRTRERNARIKIADFAARNYQVCKLWFAENHPTSNVVAWMCSQFLDAIGLDGWTENECMAFRSDYTGTWNPYPETHYEWDYYGFKYPARFTQEQGGMAYYDSMIERIANKPLERMTRHEASA